MHDGTVTAHSDGPGRGSVFTVRLPVLLEPQIIDQPQEPFTERPATARHILVVDDNRDSATSLAMLLKMTGKETQTAHDGVEAIEKAETHRPDEILLDIGLPRMNGYDVCRAIRKQPWGKDMVIVALSGWGQDEDRRKSQVGRFNGHLVKPVQYAALAKLLATFDRPSG